MSTIKRLCTNESITQAYGATELTHHEPEVEPEKIEPTCTKEGSISSWKCIHCGKVREMKTKAVGAESHSGTYYCVQNGDVWSSKKKNKSSSSAKSTFTTTLNRDVDISIPWSVSSEGN